MTRALTRRSLTTLLAAAPALAPLLARAETAASAPPGESHEAHEPDETTVDTDRAASLQVMVPVLIDGQGPFKFIVDTGANTSCLSVALADRLALPEGPSVTVNTVAGAKARRSVLVERLQVGAKTRRRIRAPVLPITGIDADGVLGVDWLKGQRLVLGFKQERMEITRSRLERSRDGSVVVPARRRSGQLTIVDADLGGDPISAIIDSGSEVSLANSALRGLVRKRDRASAVGDRVTLLTVAGERFHGEGGYLPFIRLGGLQLGNVPVVYGDTHVFKLWELETAPAIIIGMDMLRQFETVALDFGRSAVRFDFPEAAPASPA